MAQSRPRCRRPIRRPQQDTYLGAQFRRIPARRGSKRAAGATTHTLLTTIWHILDHQTPYHDLGAGQFLHHTDHEHQRRRTIAQLERLGYSITIQPAAA